MSARNTLATTQNNIAAYRSEAEALEKKAIESWRKANKAIDSLVGIVNEVLQEEGAAALATPVVAKTVLASYETNDGDNPTLRDTASGIFTPGSDHISLIPEHDHVYLLIDPIANPLPENFTDILRVLTTILPAFYVCFYRGDRNNHVALLSRLGDEYRVNDVIGGGWTTSFTTTEEAMTHLAGMLAEAKKV